MRPQKNTTPSKDSTSPNRDTTPTIAALSQEKASESNAIQIPSISLPKGGGALKGIDEKFEVNAANGTASFSLPLPITPGRNGFAPSLALSYNSGGGNSPYGLGWSVGYPMIQHKTDKRLPRYREGKEEDIFMFSGAEDLVPYLKEDDDGNFIPIKTQMDDFLIQAYRPRIEGGFARIEKITHPNHGVYWKVTTRENITTFFGRNPNARIADPTNSNKIFQWLPDFSYDDKGNWMEYHYKKDSNTNEDGSLNEDDSIPNPLYEKNRKSGLALFTNTYLKGIKYGNHKAYYADPLRPYDPQSPTDDTCFFELVMDYGEHDEHIPRSQEDGAWDYRADAFSSYRSGFEIRTNRLCKRILMFHHFENETQSLGFDGNGDSIETPFGRDYLVRSLDFFHKPSSINDSGQTEVSYLTSIEQSGYIRKADGTYAKKSLPPMEFTYEKLNWKKNIKTVSPENVVNAPVGLTNNYQWIDLYGEGISGILTEQAEAWYYKNNLGDIDEGGDVAFTVAQKVIPKPSFLGLGTSTLSIRDLEANGEKQVVVYSPGRHGYFELNHDNTWEAFKAFDTVANVDERNPFVRLIDFNGDGQPDLVMTEENVFVWYLADGKRGHLPAEYAAKTFDEERGPAIVFADQEQTIFLADMSGDGLTDIVRIRNGEICYWANMGYGKFSAKVNMAHAPFFDHDDLFNPQYLHLADVSGTGATDIIYLGKNKFKAFINLSGNAWSKAHEIDPFFPIDSNSRLSVIDLLGTGTSCIVWSSDLPHHAHAPMRYIDLMNSKKPHVMIKHLNNMGKETSMEYKSSTWFYLKDKQEGKPWITKLPFPVQVVHKTIVEEKITNVRFASEYSYHHGYYDHPEREFRGFGRVEQLDTEQYSNWRLNNTGNQLEHSEELYQPPMLTKTWFHTGAFLDRERILNQFEKEYWYKAYNELFPTTPLTVTEPQLKDALLKAADSISSPNIIDQLSADEWREALRACKGMTLRQEVFALDAATENPSLADLQKQAKPYSVATHNCHIQLLQPRAKNPYGVFIITESEAINIQYERDETDPRIAHTLNLNIDDLGNVLEAASVVYPRVQADLTLPDDIQAEQNKTYITFSENQFTNDVIEPAAYRLRTVAEAKSYELTNIPKATTLYQLADFEDVLNQSSTLAYHETDNGNSSHRLIEHVRSLFYKDDLSSPLVLGQLESLGIPYESYQLAYTPELLQDIYGNKIINPDAVMGDGRFVHSEGDNNWWIRSGLIQFKTDNENITDVQNRFYSPLAYTDPFGSTSKVSYYKDYFLLMEGTEDALSNQSKVERFDFRSLSPTLLRDINDNLSAVITDELGLVKAVALLGKDLNGDNLPELELCDDLANLSPFSEAEKADITAFFKTENSNELNDIAARLLGRASSRLVYSFDAYKDDEKPVVTATIIRENHFHQLPQNENSKLQYSFEYTDGLGNVAMVKAPAEPGLAQQAVVQDDGTYQVNTINTATDFADSPRLRWIGNGRTVLNNKGNPVKQYEPYFSVTPHYEDAPELVETGVTPILYYDAPGRLVKTVLPDETFSKVEFDSWKQISYDQNDTVLESQWYEKRINRRIDAELIAAGKDPIKEKVAAEKAEKHANTPSTLHLDTLGRPFFSVEHNRGANNTDKFYETRIIQDIEGNTRAVIDARGNTVMAYQYDILGHRVYEKSMDKGERWMLNNVMGNPVKSWDSRNHIISATYDALQRPLETKVEGGDGASPLNHIFEKNVYGENQPNAKARNLRGQLLEQYDTAGKVLLEEIDLKGNILKSTRRFAIDYKNTVNWQGDLAALLEAESYTDENQYDALGRITQSITPDNSITKPIYNEGNLLEQVQVTQNGNTQDFVSNINYDAKGQREDISYGNGVKTSYQYDEETFRLLHLSTRQSSGELLQDYTYTYDPVGNITEIEDKAIPTVFFGNHKIEPKSLYTYDALYRLIQAAGKEHIAQTGNNFGTSDNWNDVSFLKKYQAGSALEWRNYTQNYQYDSVGNILKMQHVAPFNNGSWTRDYDYENDNNRLKETWIGDKPNPIATYKYPHHPEHGFITSLPHLSRMDWNFKEELQATAQQVVNNGIPETTYYVYDGSGERVRKITETAALNGNTPTKKEERLYLGGIEIYKKHTGSLRGLERTTLHIMDDSSRIAMIDTQNGVDNDTDLQTIRYQMGNHLGSASLELNENAAVISYEEYHPYGATAYQAVNADIRAVAKRYRYTGMERDEESGLAYHSARYYLPWLGRWLSGDPIGIGDGVNLYSYSGNNPIIKLDKSGEEWCFTPGCGDFSPVEFIADVAVGAGKAVYHTAKDTGARGVDLATQANAAIGKKTGFYDIGYTCWSPECKKYDSSKSYAENVGGNLYDNTIGGTVELIKRIASGDPEAIGVGIVAGGVARQGLRRHHGNNPAGGGKTKPSLKSSQSGKNTMVAQKTPNTCGPACGSQLLLEIEGKGVYMSSLTKGFWRGSGLTVESLARNISQFSKEKWIGGGLDLSQAKHILTVFESTKSPFIARIGSSKGHFVIVDRIGKNKIYYRDPSGGVAKVSNRSDFLKMFSGVVFRNF